LIKSHAICVLNALDTSGLFNRTSKTCASTDVSSKVSNDVILKGFRLLGHTLGDNIIP
jgi:hypothetical protein